MPATTSVSVVVQDPLRIEAEPVSVNLVEMEDGDSTQISVRVNRIDAGRDTVTVTIKLPEGSGLNVSETSLTFDGTESQTVTVTATNNNDYTGDREVRLTFSATGYMPATVTVTIKEDDPQPEIELAVAPTALNLVRFTTSTEIEVSVAVDAELDIETMGAVSLTNGRNLAELNLSAGTTRIAIVGVSEGMGTVTVTANGIGAGTGAEQEIQTVSVTVRTPTLMISASGVDELEIEARTTADLTVTVNVEAGDTNNITVTTTVMGNTDAVSVESPVGVLVGTPMIFMVRGLDAGDATLRLTASHPDYEPASIDVAVSVYLPPVGLSASTELEITVGMTKELMIQVNARGAAQTTLTTSVGMSTMISVKAPATPTSLTRKYNN